MTQIFTYIITLAAAAFLGVNAQGEAKSHKHKEHKEKSHHEKKSRKKDKTASETTEIAPTPPEVAPVDEVQVPKTE